jgi:hypothetical protein
MVSPEGNERWAVQKYTSITPKTEAQLQNLEELLEKLTRG